LKAISELIAPLSGEVVEVNDGLAADAELINAEPYGAGWLIKIRLSDSAETDLLLGADAYEATIA
jgi:glycine cleavage system H protein